MTNLLFVDPEITFKGTVAIIGSSAKLFQANYGEEIDLHDDVVRFNRAPTEGYEKCVGGKTTLRVANNHVFNNNQMESEWGNQPRYFIRDLRTANVLYFGPDIDVWVDREKNVHESCNKFRFFYEYMGLLKDFASYEHEKNFSVGVGFTVLSIISGITPDLYGFDVDGEERTHYYGDRPAKGPCHDVDHEMMLLKELHEMGKLRLL